MKLKFQIPMQMGYVFLAQAMSRLDSMVASLLNIGIGFLNTGKLPIRYGNQHPT